MVTASGENMVQLVEVDRLTTDQAAFMDTLAVRALEQLWQNNHPGWDVPGAGLSSLVAVKHLFQVYLTPIRQEGLLTLMLPPGMLLYSTLPKSGGNPMLAQRDLLPGIDTSAS